MIDLKELERKLDESLGNETAGSLSEWLFAQRKKDIESLWGEGTLIEFLSKPNSFNQDFYEANTYIQTSDNSPCSHLANAA